MVAPGSGRNSVQRCAAFNAARQCESDMQPIVVQYRALRPLSSASEETLARVSLLLFYSFT